MKRKLIFICCLGLVGLMIYHGLHNYFYNHNKFVLCYGDSNTFGYNPEANGKRYQRDKCWPYILSDKLGQDFYVISEGLSGRTVTCDYTRKDGWMHGQAYLKSAILSQNPLDYVIIMLGTNDCANRINLSVENIQLGLEDCILTVRETSMDTQGYIPKIIIVVPLAFLSEYDGTIFVDEIKDEAFEKTHALSSAYKEIADKYECGFVDATTDIEVSRIDCVHMTLKGHEELASKIYEEIIRI